MIFDLKKIKPTNAWLHRKEIYFFLDLISLSLSNWRDPDFKSEYSSVTIDNTFYRKSRILQEGPDRVRLLGIMYAGFRYKIESKVYQNLSGQLDADVTPKNQSIITHIPMGITLAIKSTELLDFIPRLKKDLKL